MGADKLMPPRLRDWTKGQYQIGLFIRTPTGGVVEMCTNKPNEADVAAAMALVTALTSRGTEGETDA